MSELKDYELPLQFRQVSNAWAGRWNEYFQQARRTAEKNVALTVEQVVNEEEQQRFGLYHAQTGHDYFDTGVSRCRLWL